MSSEPEQPRQYTPGGSPPGTYGSNSPRWAKEPGKWWSNENEDRTSRVVMSKQPDGSVIVMVQSVDGTHGQALMRLEDRFSAAMFLAEIPTSADERAARQRQGIRLAVEQGRMKGRQPALKPEREAELVNLYRAGNHTVNQLGDMFGVTRSTVYRAIRRSAAQVESRAEPMPQHGEAEQ